MPEFMADPEAMPELLPESKPKPETKPVPEPSVAPVPATDAKGTPCSLLLSLIQILSQTQEVCCS